MAINSITQTISTIPPAGARGIDIQTQFVIKQEDFQDHLQGTTVTELNTFKDQLNTRIGEINSTTTTMNGYANTASAGASTATTKAGEASTSASGALTSKNQASTFATNSSNSATKASQWADNNYNVAVETGKYSAKHWATVAQNATANKVNKVTSTDNAVVRFDGTTGEVQNSSILIDDSGNLNITGNVLITSPAGLGYGHGSGGTVTQLTNKSTAVTLNKPTGQITMNNEALAVGSQVVFAFNNSLIGANDIIISYLIGGGIGGNYTIYATGGTAGSCGIWVTNKSGGVLSDALIIQYIIIKGANS